MGVLLKNNAVSRLASSLTSGATTLSVTSGQGTLFPAPTGGDWFPVTLIKASGALEVLKCTARSGDVLTVARAQEGTAAQAFAVGDRVELRLTAAAISEIQATIQALSNSLGTAATANVQTSAEDVTANALMSVGAFGLGKPLVSSQVNANNYVTSGFYIAPATGLVNFPSGVTSRPIVLVAGGSNYVTQIVFSMDGGELSEMLFRSASTANIGTTAWRKSLNDNNYGSVIDYWAIQPIGVPIPILYDGAGQIPPNDKSYRYIKMTASDSYNSGVLISESVTGTAPLVIATAVISLSGSPLNGFTVSLINTERRVLRAGAVRSVEQDAMQGHVHNTPEKSPFNDFGSWNSDATRYSTASASGFRPKTDVPSTDGTNGTPRTANETRVKNIGVTYYMRVK